MVDGLLPKATRVMLSDEFMNCVGFEENSITDLSKIMLEMKGNKKMKSKDLLPRRVGKLDNDHDDIDDDDIMIIDPPLVKEENFGHERKQEPMLGLLTWLKGIAKNPCDPSVCSLPEKSKWKSYGIETIWKQVLMVREEMFVKRHIDSSSEQSFLQKYQRMHPCMYDDDTSSSYNLRERLRIDKVLSKEAISKAGGSNNTTLGTNDSSPTDSSDDYKPVALGPKHQARVPEWNGVASKSELKWLGTQDWPLKKANNRSLVERDPIGKGRQDSCGCPEAGSINCVKFHIAKKRIKLKLELGTAFLQWKFNKMGEDVTLSWTVDDEEKFQDIVTSNPPSLGQSFWDPIIESFPSRSRADLISYYYNVFLLRRRGHQNRVTPDDIDSDDDSESGISTNGSGHEADKLPGSILYSPKKLH